VRRELSGEITLLWRAIGKPESIETDLDRANGIEPYNLIIVGAGTRSRPLVHRIREHLPSVGILVVDEQDTSLLARERYWEHHQRRGWRRLIPATLQLPPEPVDDFVAMILAERVLGA
jgi:hypothetical protein